MPWLSQSWFNSLLSVLQQMEREISTLHQKVDKMSQATDNLAAAVQRETTVQTSAIALIQGIADQLRQVSTDPQVQALADQLNQNTDALARSVADNTPAAPQSGSAAPQS